MVCITGKIELAVLHAAAAAPSSCGARELPLGLAVVKRPDCRDESGLGFTSMPTLLKDTHGITEPRMTAVPPTMASRASGAFGDMAGRSSTRSCHPGAGTGHEGSGCQPGGAAHPAGAGGQPGGGLNRVVLAVILSAPPWGPAVTSDRPRSRPVPPLAPAFQSAMNFLAQPLARSKSPAVAVVATSSPWSVVR